MDIDQQRIAAVRMLKTMGYGYRKGEWLPPSEPSVLPMSTSARRINAPCMASASEVKGTDDGEAADTERRLADPDAH